MLQEISELPVGLTVFRIRLLCGYSGILGRQSISESLVGSSCLRGFLDGPDHRSNEINHILLTANTISGFESCLFCLPICIEFFFPDKAILIGLDETVHQFCGLIDHAFSGSSQSGFSEFFHVPAAFLKCIRAATCKKSCKENRKQNNNQSVSDHSVLPHEKIIA